MPDPLDEAKAALAADDADRIRDIALGVVVARPDLAREFVEKWVADRSWYNSIPLWVKLLSIGLSILAILATLTGCIAWGWLIRLWMR